MRPEHGDLAGWVRNEADMVRIEAQGEPAALEAFVDALRHSPPPQARVDAVEVEEIRDREISGRPFEIRTSEGTSPPRPTIPADLATCAECLAEIRDPSQRRYHYPFTNCTNCGPRWSIIEQLPYDRPRTSMAGFAMCPECRAEYENPADRRFHAQPIACPALRADAATARHGTAAKRRRADAAFDGRGAVALAGQIVALKGLGGFQLLVDATDAEAVARLRQRKRRPDRPFAVMLPVAGRRAAVLPRLGRRGRELCSHRSPIVLLRRGVGRSVASPSSVAAQRSDNRINITSLSIPRPSSLASPPAIRTWASCCPTRRCTTC